MHARQPVDHRRAFADESFQEATAGGFYVLAAAIFEPRANDGARDVLRGLHGKRRGKLHWNDMDGQQQHNAAKRLGELDGFHIVTVGSPVPRRRQERARAVCLRRLVAELHGYGVSQLIMEGRAAKLNARDVQTVAGARYDLPRGASFRVDHTRGAAEPLLWAADVIAGAVRASEEGRPDLRAPLDHCVYEIRIGSGC